MNLHHLRIFHTVALYASYSRAADALQLSQPAVSMQVRKLEENLRVALFEQVGRSLALTDAGRKLKEYADHIFRLDSEAETVMAEYVGLKRGHLRVGASTTPGAYLLPPAISRFEQRYPGVRISLRIENSRRTHQRLLEGDIDLGVVGEEPVPDPAVHRELFLRDCLVVVTSPSHPLAGAGAPISAKELSEQRLVVREPGSSTRDILETRMREASLPFRPALELASTEAIKHAVAAGLGVAVLSAYAVQWEVSCGKLARVALHGLSLDRELFLATLADRKSGALIEAFTALLREMGLASPC